MKRIRYGWTLVVLMTLLTLACGLGQTETPTTETPATETQVAQVTPLGTTAPPTAETTTPPPVTTEAPPVEGPGGCQLRAAYVADVTIPDNTVLAPGAEFVKTWRIRNSGTCAWETGTAFLYTSGDPLGGPTSVAVPATAPGTQIDVSVTLHAPAAPGTYRSNWQLRAADGTQFGGIFYVQIVVQAPGGATETPTTESPAAPTNFTGAVAADCSKVTLTWTDGAGEGSYRIEAPGLNQTLGANVTSYEWTSPPAGSSMATLIALAADSSEIGRVSVTVNVACGSGQPDLIVEAITFAPTTPAAYLNTHVSMRVRNQGAAASSGFVARWWGSKTASAAACEWNVSGGLAAGATTTLECDYIYPSPYSSITAKGQVDVNDAVTESAEGNNILEQATAVNSPVTVYDFVERAPYATWQAGTPSIDLSWNGASNDTNGFARWATGNLETGGTIQGHCLNTHPRWVDNGWINGTYIDLYNTGYTVQSGDRFRATVGLLQGAGAGNVTFKVMLRTQSSGNIWIGQVADGYDNTLRYIDVDLSPYAGQRADAILKVEAGSSSQQDWACWLTAAIYRYP